MVHGKGMDKKKHTSYPFIPHVKWTGAFFMLEPPVFNLHHWLPSFFAELSFALL